MRVSTAQQNEARQVEALKNYDIEKWFLEKESAKDTNRPKLQEGYIITVSEDLTENIEFNIKVTNQIEPDRFYEDKHSKENLFLKNKLESAENDPA